MLSPHLRLAPRVIPVGDNAGAFRIEITGTTLTKT